MNRLTLLDHLKDCAQRAKNFSGRLVSDLANAMTEAVDEVAGKLTAHTGDTAIHVSKEDRDKWDGKAAKPKYVSVNLPAANWIFDDPVQGPFSQIVNVSGVTATNVVTAAPDPAYWVEAGNAGVCCTAQNTNKLMFQSLNKPDVDLTYNILIQEVE